LLHDQFVLLAFWGVRWEQRSVAERVFEREDLDGLRIDLATSGEEFLLELEKGVSTLVPNAE